MYYIAKKVYPKDVNSYWWKIVDTKGVRIADVEGRAYAEFITKCLNQKIEITEFFNRDKPSKMENREAEDHRVSDAVGKDFLREKYGDFFKRS